MMCSFLLAVGALWMIYCLPSGQGGHFCRVSPFSLWCANPCLDCTNRKTAISFRQVVSCLLIVMKLAKSQSILSALNFQTSLAWINMIMFMANSALLALRAMKNIGIAYILVVLADIDHAIFFLSSPAFFILSLSLSPYLHPFIYHSLVCSVPALSCSCYPVWWAYPMGD